MTRTLYHSTKTVLGAVKVRAAAGVTIVEMLVYMTILSM